MISGCASLAASRRGGPLRLALVLGLVSLISPAARAAPGSTAGDVELIRQGERAFGQTFVTGDAKALERLLADGFRGVDAAGRTYDKAEAIRRVSSGPPASSDALEDVAVRVYGAVAVAQAVEHVVGPPPERRPSRTVFTDTWLKTREGWRIIAAEDLDPGAATPAAFAADRGLILAARAESNRALAAHDLAAFRGLFAEDAVFVWSDGTSAVGQAALGARFSADFADPGFVTYIRTPTSVAVSTSGARAVEHGVWTALKRDAGVETRYGGDYAAHWLRTPEGWRVRGELYVKLRCEGPRCTP